MPRSTKRSTAPKLYARCMESPRLATYDTEPLAIEAKVILSFGRRYLELMAKVDELMPMLETLAIDEVIEVAQLDLQKGLTKKSVRQVAGAARNFAGGLRQRMNAMVEGDATQEDSGRAHERETTVGCLTHKLECRLMTAKGRPCLRARQPTRRSTALPNHR